jgi:hypothetical protein
MRVILITPRALVSMLCPCLCSIVCLGSVVGTDGLERVDFCTMKRVKLPRLNSRNFGYQGRR